MNIHPIRFAVLGVLLVAVFAAPFAAGQDAPKKPDPPGKKGKPKFTIGKETTYVTKPVDKDGYIDYVAALNEHLKKGVTPEKNAVVVLMKAFGPRPEGGPVSVEFFKWLDMEPPPEKGAYFQTATTYLKDEHNINFNHIFDQWVNIEERPWAAKDYPHFAAWLKANDKPLAMVVEATKREGYFMPYVSTKSKNGMIEALPISEIQQLRSLASVLVVRANLRIGENATMTPGKIFSPVIGLVAS